MEEHLRQVKLKKGKIAFDLSVFDSEEIDFIGMINQVFHIYNKTVYGQLEFTSSLKEHLKKIKQVLLTKTYLPKNLYNEIEELLEIFESYIVMRELSKEEEEIVRWSKNI